MSVSHLTASVDERLGLAQARLGELVLGKWRLGRVIGVGGMATVFEASHHNGSRVAIKILHADLATSEDIRERFLTEGYVANRVSHPGVVTVLEEGTTTDGALFLVMDLLRGQTLAERWAGGAEPFSVVGVLEIASQLLEVLVHAHDRGIVHGDIKPENVFLTREGRVRLLDFGIARLQERSRAREAPAGSTLGTPAFMSPEQALGAHLDGRSDLWSLGATLFLLLSGRPVRERGSATEQLLCAMTRPAPSLGSCATLPRSVIAVVDRALSFEREERFPDARSMQLAVRAAVEELSTPDARATLPPPSSLEPVAMALRTPRPAGGHQRPSSPTVRPVAFNEQPLPGPAHRESPGALPFFIALGFALGIGIVIAARIPTWHTGTQAGAAPLSEGSTLVPIVPAPSASASAAPSASVRRPPAARPTSASRH